MGYNARVTEISTLAGAVLPASSTIGSWFTDAIDMSVARRWVHTIPVYTLSGGATVDYGVYTSATSGGTYAALAGASIATESTGSKIFVIEVSTESVVNTTGKQWMKGYLQVKVAAGVVTPTVRGYDPAFAPTTDGATGAQTPNVVYT